MPANPRRIIAAANKLADGQAKKVLSYLERQHAELTRLLVSELGTKWDKIAWERVRQAVYQKIAQINADLMRRSADMIAAAGLKGQQAARAQIEVVGRIGISPETILSNPFIRTAMEQRATLVTAITEEIRAKIDAAIDRGLQGLDAGIQVINQIADIKGLGESVFGTVKNRAEVIFRNETSRVLNETNITETKELVEQNPELYEKYWLGTNDDRIRETHLEIWRKTDPAQGGTPIPVDDDFELSDGDVAYGPHDPRLAPENQIQCRCRLIVQQKTS